MHQLDVAIPLQLKSQLKKGSTPACTGDADADIDTMQFVMLTRKGNKQQVCVKVCVGYGIHSLG